MPVMLSATNVAIPIVANEFSLSANQIAWIPMSYLMASVMFVLIFGKLADVLGKKRIFHIGLLVLCFSSIFITFAYSGAF